MAGVVLSAWLRETGSEGFRLYGPWLVLCTGPEGVGVVSEWVMLVICTWADCPKSAAEQLAVLCC